MAMTVSYSVVPRKNPAKKSEPAKYYAQAQASGELDFEELCEAITSRSTCTETDVRAAISGILYEVKRALKAGRIVRLGDLGSLQIGLNSEGATSVKEFTGSLIKGAHIIFRPGKTLAELMIRTKVPVAADRMTMRLRTLQCDFFSGKQLNEDVK